MSASRALLPWVVTALRPRLGLLLGVLVLSCCASALSLAGPYFTKLLIDDGLLAARPDRIWPLCGLMVGAALFSVLLEGANRLCYVRVSADVLFSLRETVYRHLQGLSPTYYARTQSGEILSRLDGDVAEVQRFAVDMPLAFINACFGLLATVALMLTLSPALSLLAAVVIPLELLVLRRLRPRVEVQTRALREKSTAISAFLVETLRAMKFVQGSNSEQRDAERLTRLHGDYRITLQSSQVVNLAASGIPRVLNAMSTALVFGVGGYWVATQKLSLGSLIAFSAYLARANGPAQSLMGLYLGWQRTKVSLARVAELQQEIPAVTSPKVPTPLPDDAPGEITVENIHFAHGQENEVLRGARVFIPGGSKIVISGASGAGKSTLIDLLLRYYDPQAGRILLDGIDLRLLDLSQLRQKIAMVGQEVVLFPGSIADNLRYVKPDASDDELQDALECAHLGLARFAQGLATPVGTGGAAISGGERQRIAIARAVLQNPAVLILDEATSAVDGVMARAIITEVDRLFAGRTRLIVTHQPQLAGLADRWLALEDGQLRVLQESMPNKPWIRSVS